MLQFLEDIPITMTTFAPLKDLETLWSPFLFCMRFVGLYSFKPDHHESAWIRWRNPLKIYSCLIFLICLSMSVGFLVSAELELVTREGLIMVGCDVFWKVSTICFSGAYIWTCHSSSKLKCLFDIWSQLQLCSKDGILVERKIRFWAWVIAVTACLLTLICLYGNECFTLLILIPSENS